jgi:hypothetical protein
MRALAPRCVGLLDKVDVNLQVRTQLWISLDKVKPLVLLLIPRGIGSLRVGFDGLCSKIQSLLCIGVFEAGLLCKVREFLVNFVLFHALGQGEFIGREGLRCRRLLLSQRRLRRLTRRGIRIGWRIRSRWRVR